MMNSRMLFTVKIRYIRSIHNSSVWKVSSSYAISRKKLHAISRGDFLFCHIHSIYIYRCTYISQFQGNVNLYLHHGAHRTIRLLSISPIYLSVCLHWRACDKRYHEFAARPRSQWALIAYIYLYSIETRAWTVTSSPQGLILFSMLRHGLESCISYSLSDAKAADADNVPEIDEGEKRLWCVSEALEIECWRSLFWWWIIRKNICFFRSSVLFRNLSLCMEITILEWIYENDWNDIAKVGFSIFQKLYISVASWYINRQTAAVCSYILKS